MKYIDKNVINTNEVIDLLNNNSKELYSYTTNYYKNRRSQYMIIVGGSIYDVYKLVDNQWEQIYLGKSISKVRSLISLKVS